MSGPQYPETRIFVARRYKAVDSSWSEWTGQTFEEVVDKVVEKVREGEARSLGMEVIEVAVVSRVFVQPKIERVTVTDSDGSAVTR